jgi:hypothetical protein
MVGDIVAAVAVTALESLVEVTGQIIAFLSVKSPGTSRGERRRRPGRAFLS